MYFALLTLTTVSLYFRLQTLHKFVSEELNHIFQLFYLYSSGIIRIKILAFIATEKVESVIILFKLFIQIKSSLHL